MRSPTPYQMKQLADAAWRAAGNSYAPVSGFPVGAAILTASGKIVPGCNVENEAEGVIMCAERTALFSARAQGLLDEKAVAVAVACVAGDPNQAREGTPCGGCRQAMVELCEPDALIGIASVQHDRTVISRRYSLNQLEVDGFVIGDHDANSTLPKPDFPALSMPDPNPPTRMHDAWGYLIPQLNDAALEAAKNSYLRFTKAAVGAAVLTGDQEIVVGTFVENSSTGLSICAERAAFLSARAQGKLERPAMAIAVARVDANGLQPKDPCGPCRETVRELARPWAVVSLVGGPVYEAERLLPSMTGRSAQPDRLAAPVALQSLGLGHSL